MRALAAALAVAAAVLAAGAEARAEQLRFTGGMGITLWSLGADGGAGRITGFGAGINGRVLMQIGDHLRVQAGLLQAETNHEDGTHLLRRIIGGAVEGLLWPSGGVYAGVGLRLGAENLEMVETVEPLGDDRRLVRDVDRWAFVGHPFVVGGVRLVDRYHVELETGVVLSMAEGRLEVFYTAVLGVYFRMGGRSHSSATGPTGP